ncbi:MAG: hypothetical protein V4457_05995 [Pseudomonadota bacterium]
MSNTVKDIGGALRNVFIKPSKWGIDQVGEGHLNPFKMPNVNLPAAPGVPQTDQAAQNLQQLDRIRARKGVLANLYGGANGGAAPTTGQKQLLGS